jgi:hypothetical protein
MGLENAIGDLATLGSISRLTIIERPCGLSSMKVQRRDGIEQLTTMPDILHGQARKDCVVYFVLAECRLMLSAAKARQPTPQVHGPTPKDR